MNRRSLDSLSVDEHPAITQNAQVAIIRHLNFSSFLDPGSPTKDVGVPFVCARRRVSFTDLVFLELHTCNSYP